MVFVGTHVLLAMRYRVLVMAYAVTRNERLVHKHGYESETERKGG